MRSSRSGQPAYNLSCWYPRDISLAKTPCSWEAFADWFDEYVESLEDIEEDGRDFMEVMMEWCEANNHEWSITYEGVFNHNIKWHKATRSRNEEDSDDEDVVD